MKKCQENISSQCASIIVSIVILVLLSAFTIWVEGLSITQILTSYLMGCVLAIIWEGMKIFGEIFFGSLDLFSIIIVVIGVALIFACFTYGNGICFKTKDNVSQILILYGGFLSSDIFSILTPKIRSFLLK